MDIYAFGFTAVRLRGKKTTLIIDPFDKEKTGVKFEKTEADAILLTDKSSQNTSLTQVNNFRVVIDGPGEYEVGGAAVVGIPVGKVTTFYIKMDGLSLLHLGALEKPLSETELEKYPSIDIAFVPVSGADMIATLEPKIVVPINGNKETTSSFLKELGKEEIKPQSKLSITKDKLPQELEIAMLG